MVTRAKGSVLNSADMLSYANIVDYGARSDGVTDCAAAIIAAFAVSAAVFVPVGTFTTSAISVPAGSVLFGTGDTSVLKLKSAGNADLVTLGSGSLLKDIALDGNKINQSAGTYNGITVANTVDSQIMNVGITATKGSGVLVSGAATNRLLIDNVVVSGHTSHGILVTAGSNIEINKCLTVNSDVSSPNVDGISVLSGGLSISNVIVTNCISLNNTGRGIVVAGNGTKNVTDVTVQSNIVAGNTNHGIYLLTTERNTVSNNISKFNLQDGIRLEGDVQNCRVSNNISSLNTAFGIREVILGSTPNLNGLIYNVATSNTDNTITKVGASSFVV